MRVAKVLQETQCPFCGIDLEITESKAKRGLVDVGRGAILAGALAGMTSVVAPGCGAEDKDPPTATADGGMMADGAMMADMAMTTPDAGADASTDTLVREDVNDEPDPQQDYGGGFNNSVNNVTADAGSEQ
jgi:hypothetical protein